MWTVPKARTTHMAAPPEAVSSWALVNPCHSSMVREGVFKSRVERLTKDDYTALQSPLLPADYPTTGLRTREQGAPLRACRRWKSSDGARSASTPSNTVQIPSGQGFSSLQRPGTKSRGHTRPQGKCCAKRPPPLLTTHTHSHHRKQREGM